jgi:hypothetical protein
MKKLMLLVLLAVVGLSGFFVGETLMNSKLWLTVGDPAIHNLSLQDQELLVLDVNECMEHSLSTVKESLSPEPKYRCIFWVYSITDAEFAQRIYEQVIVAEGAVLQGTPRVSPVPMAPPPIPPIPDPICLGMFGWHCQFFPMVSTP